MKKQMEIHVGRLVLHGIETGRRRLVRQAVERELGRIGARGEIAADRRLQIPEIHLPGGENRS